jgi:hypothetical protein
MCDVLAFLGVDIDTHLLFAFMHCIVSLEDRATASITKPS